METGTFFAIQDKCLAFIESRLTQPFNAPARDEAKQAIAEKEEAVSSILSGSALGLEKIAALCDEKPLEKQAAVTGFCG
jgi:hypothetical protein